MYQIFARSFCVLHYLFCLCYFLICHCAGGLERRLPLIHMLMSHETAPAHRWCLDADLNRVNQNLIPTSTQLVMIPPAIKTHAASGYIASSFPFNTTSLAVRYRKEGGDHGHLDLTLDPAMETLVRDANNKGMPLYLETSLKAVIERIIECQSDESQSSSGSSKSATQCTSLPFRQYRLSICPKFRVELCASGR